MKNISNFIKSMNEKNALLMEIVRFVFVGVLATLVDYAISALVLFAMNPGGYPTFFSIFGIGEHASPTSPASILSTGIGFVAGLAVNYLLSVFIVYINKGKSKTPLGFIIFTVLSIVGLCINILGMWLIYDVSGLISSEYSMVLYWLIKIVLTLIVLVYNYLTRKYIIFKREKTQQVNEEGENSEK